MTLFFSHPKTSTIPAPLPHTHVASASSSVSPSPFAVPSRESTSKPREESAHMTAISTADKGNHASLGREDEDEADPAPGSDIEMRSALMAPIVIETRVQYWCVLANVLLCAYTYAT